MRTSKADQNYLSLNRDSVVWYAGTDHAQQGEIPVPCHLLPTDAHSWDAILKCSDRHDTSLSYAKVAQGRENSLDINNRSSNLSFNGEWGLKEYWGDQAFTIKGGSHDIKVSGLVWSEGHKATVVIGAWSDQSMEPSYNLDFSSLQHGAGLPLTFIFGRVRHPIMAALGRSKDIKLPRGAKVLFWASIGEQIYWWGKRAAVALGLFGK